jgi:hypothetical protein
MAEERADYTIEAVDAARSVIIELVHILGEYRDHMVLVGGWIPDLLLPQSQDRHVGSIDVDLALDNRQLTESGYRTISEILSQSGYIQDKQQPFVFRKEVHGQIVKIDFLAGEYGGTGQSHRTQKFLEMRPRKARGCDLAFEIPPAKIELKGKLPNGALDEVRLQISSVVPFLIMKGMAMEDRRKAKDAYDLYSIIQNYPGGLEEIAKAFEPYLKMPLVQEGSRKIAGKFGSVDHVGPKDVADFFDLQDEEERSLLQRDVYEKVSFLLNKLGVL